MVPWRMLYGAAAPFAAPELADHGQAPLLALRMLLLLLAALRLASAPGRASVVRFAAVAALVVASLLAQIAFVPAMVIACVVLATWPGRSGTAGWGWRLAPGAALLLALGMAPWMASRGDGGDAAEREENLSPPRATARALERGNLYEARFWAEQWARLEQADPRQGTLILARVEHQAGHDARARLIAADVAARSSVPAVRAQAQQTLATLPSAGDAP